jgi:hypothetical protein
MGKQKADTYATWISERMSWPVPPEFYLTAPRLTREWDDDAPEGLGEKEVRDILEGLTVDKGRVVLMARGDELQKLSHSPMQWETEPWYGTKYRVEKFDEAFMKEVRGSSHWIWIDNVMEEYRRECLMISPNCSYLDPTSLFLLTWTWINERFPRLVIPDLICIVVARRFFLLAN